MTSKLKELCNTLHLSHLSKFLQHKEYHSLTIADYGELAQRALSYSNSPDDLHFMLFVVLNNVKSTRDYLVEEVKKKDPTVNTAILTLIELIKELQR